MDADLLQRIGETPLQPNLWPLVLGDVGTHIDAPRGALCLGAEGDRMIVAYGAQPGVLPLASPCTAARLRFVPTAVLSDRAGDLGQGLGAFSSFDLPGGAQATLHWSRSLGSQPLAAKDFAVLDALRPALAAALRLSARLRLENARAATETLAALGLPSIALDGEGRALFANRLAEQRRDLSLRLPDGRFALRDRAANALLRDALQGASAGAVALTSFPVRDAGGRPTDVAHLLPLRSAAAGLFREAVALIAFAPVGVSREPSRALLQSLFRLTAAEAEIARELARGRNVESIAERQAISVNTVRAHVRGVLEKTGRHRQSEVVALLAQISAGPAEAAPAA